VPADADPPVTVPPLVLARWDQGSSRLFGPLVMDPELYERVVVVLARLMERLRAVTPGLATLLERADSTADLAEEVLAELSTGTAPVDLDPAVLAQAALAQRYRELRPLEEARRRLALLAAAQDWVVLEEDGDPQGDPYLPYRRLEADPRTGRAVLVRSDPDEDYTRTEHLVTPGRIDLETGELLLDVDLGQPGTLADVDARERAAAELRAAP
jgi:hypothetical protein